jgi:DNA mismatch repair protein MutS2
LAAEAEAKAAQRRSEALNADLRYRLAKVEEARREVLAQAQAQAVEELESLRAEIAGVRGQLAGLGGIAPAKDGQTRHAAWLAEAEAVLARRAAQARPIPSISTPEPVVVEGPLQPGDVVWVPSLQASGEVASVTPNEIEVKAGAFRLKLAPGRMELRQRGGQEAIQASVGTPRPPSPGMELDLRGLTVDDMLVELDRYLDTAYLAGLPFVRIIHGKGTGALRQAVREELRHHPLVKEQRPGEYNEGGEGVTVARLVQR